METKSNNRKQTREASGRFLVKLLIEAFAMYTSLRLTFTNVCCRSEVTFNKTDKSAMIARFQQSRGDLLPRNACMRLDPAHDSYCLSERERRSMTCRRPVHVFSSQSRRPVLQQRRHQHWGAGARAFIYRQLVAELPSMETLQSRGGRGPLGPNPLP